MLNELNDAVEVVRQIADPDANIIFGANIEKEMDGKAAITLIATGLNSTSGRKSSSTVKSHHKDKNDYIVDLFSEENKRAGIRSELSQGEHITYRGENLEKPAIWRKKGRTNLAPVED